MSLLYQSNPDKYSKRIVYGYIHELQKYHKFYCNISIDIFNMCLLFYYQRYIKLDGITRSPLTILLAIYNAKLSLNIINHNIMNHKLDLANDIIYQCKYLNKISTQLTQLDKSKFVSHLTQLILFKTQNKQKQYIFEINHVLLMYQNDINLLSSKNIDEWTDHDIILSFINVCTLDGNISIGRSWTVSRISRMWMFVDYMRHYLYSMKYDGFSMLEFMQLYKGFGLTMLKRICKKYKIRQGPYALVKKLISFWSKQLLDRFESIYKSEIMNKKIDLSDNYNLLICGFSINIIEQYFVKGMYLMFDIEPFLFDKLNIKKFKMFKDVFGSDIELLGVYHSSLNVNDGISILLFTHNYINVCTNYKIIRIKEILEQNMHCEFDVQFRYSIIGEEKLLSDDLQLDK